VVKTGPLAVAAAHGRATIAVRVPDHGVLRQALDAAGAPVAATSANRSGKPSVTDGVEAIRQFTGRVDVIIDGGPCAVGRESSVVDVTRYPFSVLRVGAVSKSELERVLRVA
jgi:L-threonylcarbamoyladenylate synthase